MKDLKLKVKNMCEFNNGKGSIALYFTKKEMRELKKLGISEREMEQARRAFVEDFKNERRLAS